MVSGFERSFLSTLFAKSFAGAMNNRPCAPNTPKCFNVAKSPVRVNGAVSPSRLSVVPHDSF